jgi:hypothetical protein
LGLHADPRSLSDFHSTLKIEINDALTEEPISNVPTQALLGVHILGLSPSLMSLPCAIGTRASFVRYRMDSTRHAQRGESRR